MTQYEQNIIGYATQNPGTKMPFRHGWDLLNKPDKRVCFQDLKKIFGVGTYESVRARISGDKRIKISVFEAIQIAKYFYEKFGIDNPWGDGL